MGDACAGILKVVDLSCRYYRVLTQRGLIRSVLFGLSGLVCKRFEVFFGIVAVVQCLESDERSQDRLLVERKDLL